MKKRRVWRYTCDFCRKTNCSGASIAKHEKHCCKNPARECRMCNTTWPRPELEPVLAQIRDIDEDTEADVTAQLAQAVAGCPACMLTAFLQAPLPMVEWDIPGEWQFGEFVGGSHGEARYRVKWSFKDALAKWWAEKNEAAAQESARDSGFH